jgi:2-polyprenyl-6-methoxyphenol hydroxylase-like FAD-dependent oxidoreductase
MPRPYRVGVVGLGVAGASVACLLARDGHQVTVLERAPQPRPIGAGVLLQSSGQKVLDRMGLLKQVADHAAPIEELHARHNTGKTMLRTRFADFEPGCRAYGVHRGVLFQALYDDLRTTGAEVRLGCEAIAREVRAEGVFLLDAWGGRHGPFDFTLAAEGSRSRLRKACGLHADVTEYPHGTLWMIVPDTGVPGTLLQVVRGCRNLFGLLPLGDGLVTLYWGLPASQWEEVRKAGLEALKREVLSFSLEAAPALEMVVDMSQLILTSYRHVSMRRWHDRHTLFLGDAAHAMSPHLGQGINLALLDAWCFAHCLRGAATPQEAFTSYSRARRAQLNYYATVTYLLSPFFQSDWDILGWGRDLFLPLLPRIPWVKRQMLMTVAGVKGGWLSGPMDV